MVAPPSNIWDALGNFKAWTVQDTINKYRSEGNERFCGHGIYSVGDNSYLQYAPIYISGANILSRALKAVSNGYHLEYAGGESFAVPGGSGTKYFILSFSETHDQVEEGYPNSVSEIAAHLTMQSTPTLPGGEAGGFLLGYCNYTGGAWTGLVLLPNILRFSREGLPHRFASDKSYDFGDGSDGEQIWVTPQSLTRDIFASRLYIAADVETNGFRLLASEFAVITNNAKVKNNGSDGANGGSGGAGGAGAPDGTLLGGGDGGDGRVIAGEDGEDMDYGCGGDGGRGGSGYMSYGEKGAVTNPLELPRATSLFQTMLYRNNAIGGGAGGGGGGGNDGAIRGGGGGGAAGGVYIGSPYIYIISGQVQAIGGDGGNGEDTGPAGGGGGGGGGWILFHCFRFKSDTLTPADVSGGTGGTPTGGGFAGSNGSDGKYAIVAEEQIISSPA